MNTFKHGLSIELYGTAWGDTLSVVGTIGNLYGGRGDDALIFSSPDQFSTCTLQGGLGNDVLMAHATSAVLRGGRGNDTLIGASRFNDMFGGLGHDTFVIEHGEFSFVQDFQRGIDSVVAPRGATVEKTGGYTFIHEGCRTIAEIHGLVGAHDLIFA